MNKQSSLFQEISIETIRNIFVNTLQEEIIWDASLLDGGMFNTTYLVEYSPFHKKAVLRLGPVNRHLIMGFEENLMNAEEYVYSVCKDIGVPGSRVLVCDSSKKIIDRDFMIVEYIPSVVMLKADLTDERRSSLYRQMGIYLAKIHQVTNDHFGFLSRIRDGIMFEKWSDALIFEIEDIAERLKRSGGLDEKESLLLKSCFYKSRALLDEIKIPHLLHTDLWEGNVLLDKDTLEIAAIIDSDRAVFGDVDFEFSSPWMENQDLKEGYDSIREKTTVPNDLKRRQLYRMFFYLMEAYVGLGEYNNQDLYKTRKRQLMDEIERFAI